MLEKTQTLLDAATTTGASSAISPTRNIQSYQATLSDTTTPSATVQIQGSNDGQNWLTIATLSPSGALNSVGTTITVAWVFTRANVSAIAGTSATVTVTAAY